MATTKKPNEEEVVLEEPVANPSLKINPTENYDKATATPYQAPTWNGGTGVAGQTEKLAQNVINMNYTDWTKGTDYASLTKRYSQQGQKAMDNTLGMVAARTGGLASSYATAAGNQAYNDYMTKLEDAARALYDSQRAEAKDNYGIAQGMYDRQYGEYVEDKNFGYQQYRDNVGDAQWADTQYVNQYNTEWNQDFQEGQYADSQTKDEADNLEETLYYAPDTYPDYASYKAANPNTQITEAQFNQIKAKAAGMYAENNKEWNYKTATDEEQKLHDAIYANSALYPTYADYKAAFPDSTMTESTFNLIKSTAEGQYAIDQQGRTDTQEATSRDDAREQIRTQIQANPDAEISEELLAAAGWDANTIDSYRTISREIKEETESANLTDEQNKANSTLAALIAEGMTWDEIEAGYSDVLEASNFGADYWQKKVDNVAEANRVAKQEDAQDEIYVQIQANPDAELDPELVAASGWSEATINSYRSLQREVKAAQTNQNADEATQKADDQLMKLVSSGMEWSEISANYGDLISQSSLGADYWEQQATNMTQAHWNDERDQAEVRFSQGTFPTTAEEKADLAAKTGWSIDTIDSYIQYYTDLQTSADAAELTQTQTDANNALLDLVGSGLSWETIKNNPDYAQYISDSSYGEDYWSKMADNVATTSAERSDARTRVANWIASGGDISDEDIQDLIAKSGYSTAELEQLADNRGYTTKQTQKQEQYLTQFAAGKFPASEADIAKIVNETGWDAATVVAYQDYYENIANANATEQSIAADTQLMALIGADLTWDQITANYGDLVESSSFGEDYWQNKIRQIDQNKGFTNAQLIAQDNLEMRLQSGEKMSRDEINRLAEKTGRSPQYWYAYQKVVQGGELTDEEVAVIDNPAEISSWLENILNDSTGTETADEWFMYYTNLEKIDPDLAYNALYEKVQRGEVTRDEVKSLMPYLTEEDLDALFNK